MIKTNILLLALALNILSLNAQMHIPYLGKNGMKGLADSTGKIILAPQFDDISALVSTDRPYFFATKNGESKHVLFTGETFEKNPNGIYFPVNYNEKTKSFSETWNDVALIEFYDKCLIINRVNGKRYECNRMERGGAVPWFVLDNHAILSSGNPMIKARFGVLRVQKTSTRFNFIDRQLNQIFDQDFPAGMAVDDEFFILANDEKLCAIGDRNGKILTKFQWQLLVPTPQKGIFITEPKFQGFRYNDKTEDSPAPQQEGVLKKPRPRAKTGLIDAKGKTLIEPKYRDLRVAGEKYLIFEDENATGIMDYSGKVIWQKPIQAEEELYAQLTYAHRELFILQGNEKTTLIQKKGENALPFEYERIFFENEKHPDFPYFYFKNGEISGLLDADLNMIFQEKINSITSIRHGQRLYFETNLTPPYPNPQRGLLASDGKVLFPPEYKQFDFPSPSFPYIKVIKDDKTIGLSDLEGKMILPCAYHEIFLSVGVKNNELFARPVGKNTYLAFDSQGKRTPELDCVHPMNSKNKLVYQPPVRQGDPQPVIFADGKAMIIPQSFGSGRQNLYAMGNAEDFIVLKENPGSFELYNTDLQPILPKGFAVPTNEFNPRRREDVSLVAVWQYSANYQPPPPPKEVQRTAPPSPDSDEPPMVEAVDIYGTPVLIDNALEERGPDFIGTGVLNSKGEWAIPPKEGARFQPVSNHLVLEFPLAGAERNRGTATKLHRVNHPQPASWDIAFVEDIAVKQPPENNIVWQKKYLPNGEYKGNRCTWFTFDGEQLSDFKYTSGPRKLASHNLVSTEENDVKKWHLVNEKLKKIADLPDFDESPGDGMGLHSGYFVAKIKGKYGVLDSIGQVAMPFEYTHQLEVLHHLPLVVQHEEFENNVHKLTILDFSGKPLGESATRHEEYKSSETGLVFLVLDYAKPSAHTLVFSKKGEKLYDVKGGRYSGVEFGNNQYRYAKFYDSNNKTFYMDIRDGRVFRE